MCACEAQQRGLKPKHPRAENVLAGKSPDAPAGCEPDSSTDVKSARQSGLIKDAAAAADEHFTRATDYFLRCSEASRDVSVTQGPRVRGPGPERRGANRRGNTEHRSLFDSISSQNLINIPGNSRLTKAAAAGGEQ